MNYNTLITALVLIAVSLFVPFASADAKVYDIVFYNLLTFRGGLQAQPVAAVRRQRSGGRAVVRDAFRHPSNGREP